MASYPSAIAIFTAKVNVTDIIDASHPNNIQDEVTAIEATLGTEPRLSTTPSSGGTFNGTSTTYSTLKARLDNIEQGIVADTHTQYIKKTGDSSNVVTAGSSTVKPLVLKGASGQSVNLLELQNNSGTALAYIDQSGNIQAPSITRTGGTSSQFLKADGSVDSTSYQSFSVNTSAKVANYQLAASDKDTMIQMNGAFAFQVTTALSSVPAGTQIHLLALTTGVTVTGTGVTLNGTPGLKLRAAYSSATLICLGTNNWVLVGDLSA